MKIRIYKNSAQAGEAAATLIAAQLIRKPDSVLGLATGSSPIPTYEALISLYKRGAVSFAQAVSFNLDEYIGIPEDHPCSYHRFMQEKLFQHVDMRPEAVHVPDGNAENPQAFAAAYDWAIDKAGGIDLQLLGIGRNGHIGFNEPGDHFIRGCHVVDLAESTITANQRFFNSREEVPRQAMSLGIEAILKARTVVLIASGKAKAQAVRDAIHGEITPQVQASILQGHPDAYWMLDEEAASLL
ncbi:MAG: glucosamine-6-phosphate deaminase [Clostridia bacterium]|nr:glucosamine-6-phosphate deaminase [Clostridia bacterium]